MRLGNLSLKHFLVLAPMSGITDYPFRRLAKERGCGLTFTEMVSAEGWLRKKESFLKIGEDEHPIGVQLFGSIPDTLAEAAGMAEAIGADIIDINMGCPAKQVIGTGSGVALMRSPEKVEEILIKVRGRIRIPLTIKIRSGWDSEHINAAEISKIAEDCGVDAISIHPRTRVQGFRGQANWNLIGEVKKSVNIPVIGNGDVITSFLAKKMLEETGCDGVMIGRGAFGNPWIFDPAFLEKGQEISPSLKEKHRMIEHHFSLLRNHYGEKKALKKIRRHLNWYIRGLPFCASFRFKLSGLKEMGGLFEALLSYLNFLEERDQYPSILSA